MTGATLRRLREEAGASVTALAGLLGVEAATLRLWEEGRRAVPSRRTPDIRRALALLATVARLEAVAARVEALEAWRALLMGEGAGSLILFDEGGGHD